MKNLLKLHENLAIFPLNFSQDFNGFWFCSVVLAVFLLVACRRFFFFFACSISLHCTLLVLPHTSLLFCPFQFVFCLTMLYYSSRWLSPFLFRVFFCFYRFRLYLFSPAFGCFSLWLIYLHFSLSLSWYFYASARLVFSFLLSVFAIVSFAFAFSACFVQSLAFFISGLCYFFVAFGISRFCPFGPVGRPLLVCSCSCLVFVALSRALFSHLFS